MVGVLPLVGSAVDTVAGLFNSKWERDAARRNTEDTIRAQKELAEYSYNKDVEMWNKNNAYNTPSEQMKRLEAAGLNPNMVYGSGTVAGNTSSQTPKYQMYDPQYKNVPFRLDLPSMLDVLSRYQDLKIKRVRMKALRQILNVRMWKIFILALSLV